LLPAVLPSCLSSPDHCCVYLSPVCSPACCQFVCVSRCPVPRLRLSGIVSGSGLRCYKCQDYTGRCQDVQECTYEDSCISLSERGGKTIRQCIRYTDCDNSRLSQMFPAISAFTYRCCSSNLCNSGTACTAVTPLVALLGSLLSVWWCWM
uniref:CD59 molecule (CD59 blood group) b n=1 Tax=Astatotilapia calliptera TaxID=8154 RepID=A0AAX7TJU5_ASTCA